MVSNYINVINDGLCVTIYHDKSYRASRRFQDHHDRIEWLECESHNEIPAALKTDVEAIYLMLHSREIVWCSPKTY